MMSKRGIQTRMRIGFSACIWSGLIVILPSCPFIRTACSVHREPCEREGEGGRGRDREGGRRRKEGARGRKREEKREKGREEGEGGKRRKGERDEGERNICSVTEYEQVIYLLVKEGPEDW